MFQIDPNTIYTAGDLAELSGFSSATVYSWFKDGLRHRGGAKEKSTTGRAILEYFEKDVESEEEAIDIKLAKKLKEAGIAI